MTLSNRVMWLIGAAFAAACADIVALPPADTPATRRAIVLGSVTAGAAPLHGVNLEMWVDPSGTCPASRNGFSLVPIIDAHTDTLGQYAAEVRIAEPGGGPDQACVRIYVWGPDTTLSAGPVGLSPRSEPVDSLRVDVSFP